MTEFGFGIISAPKYVYIVKEGKQAAFFDQ